MFHSQTKHIEIDVHFVRKQVAAKNLRVQYVPTEHQITDVLTKALPIARFELLRTRLNMIEREKSYKECERREKSSPQTLMCITKREIFNLENNRKNK